MEGPSITVAVVSRNEGELLPSALESATWADHLLVLDMESSDDTRDVALRMGAQVVDVPLAPVVERVRQAALDSSPTEWLFFLDPDEIAPADARRQCLDAIQRYPDAAGFRWPFSDYFFGEPLTHSRGGARKLLLMHRDRVHFSPDQAAHVEPAATAAIIDLDRSLASPIRHNTFRSIHQSVEKLTRYAMTGNPVSSRGMESSDLVLARLLFRYVIRGGAWRDGTAGINAASLSALHDYVAILRNWELAGARSRPVHRRTSAAMTAIGRLTDTIIRLRTLLPSRRK